MESESSCGRELAEFVPDHRLGDVHRYMLATIVHRQCVPDHLWDYRRPPRPSLNDLFVSSLVQRIDLLQEMVVDEWALF
jgi:hypothetical protein